jgi:hypothetical protein
MKVNLLPLIFFFIAISTFAQVRFEGNFTGKGIAFSGEESPFWMHSNQRGRMNELSNVSALLGGIASYNITENARFSFGIWVPYTRMDISMNCNWTKPTSDSKTPGLRYTWEGNSVPISTAA